MNRFRISENSLDLLLHLIHKNKIDISDIPIGLIAEEYLDYLKFMNSINVDFSNEFFIMAAKLVHIRSCSISSHFEEMDPREEITHILLDYLKKKDISSLLENRGVYQDSTDVIEDFFLPSFFELLDAFREIMKRRFKSWKIRSLPDRREEIVGFLQEKKEPLFDDLFDENIPEEIVAKFLSLLDLVRQGVIFVYQPLPEKSIKIKLK